MKIFTLAITCLICSFSFLNAQQNNFWNETSESFIPSEKSPKELQQPVDAKYFSLDFKNLKSALKDAPMEYTDDSRELILSFPLDDGNIEEFIIEESPVMAPKLAAKYPNIKSYRGTGKNNPLLSMRFNYSPLGFHGSIHSLEGKIYIDPYTSGSGDHCIVYNTNKLTQLESDRLPPLGCGVGAEFFAEPDEKEKLVNQANNQLRKLRTPVDVIVYRLALACTGEYGQTKGGTLESVNASYAVALNRVNQVFELEVAIKVELIEDNDKLIFLDPDTDPYMNANVGTGLLPQNRPAFISAGIFDDMYDAGHVFTNGCTDVGGVVSGRACTDGKARGVTCHYTSNIEAIAVDVMSHEIGHQFSCAHSWDNCPSSAQQRAGERAYEPGSGTTIMSYAGSCGNQNIVNNGDDYYNIGSLESFISFTRDVHPNCGNFVPNGNNYPVVEVPYEDGFYIPTSTPFELTAIASDEDGDPITYCWEQHDNEITASDIGAPTGNAPTFRSRRPTTSPTRTFPSMGAILGNSFNNTEVLPTYSRDLTFFCTVRDNVVDGGGTVWDEVRFKVDGESGPFRLSFPSSLDHILTAGEYIEFTWDPANSQNAPVNCKTVNLLISYDNGASFVDTLARSVINDGSYFVNVPDRASSNTRVRVEAADNIFFDLSNNRVEIEEATTPRYTFDFTPEYQEVCAPANISLDVFTSSVLGFDNPVELSIVGDLPDYISDVSFARSTLMPGEQSSIEVQIDEPGSNEVLSLTVQAVSENADTTFRTIQLDILSNDFSSLSLTEPVDGLSGVVGIPDFVWEASTTATSYTFEIATSPTFAPETIVTSEENLTDGFYQLEQVLEATTLYYWRVTPFGKCGSAEPSIPNAFHSASFDCQDVPAQDLPINISPSFSGDIESKINVTQGGAISDLNITNVTGSHSDFSDLSFSIKSPAGTIVKLVSNKCFAQSTSYNMAFDQESPFPFACPPQNIFIPEENLGAFTGEDTEGIWELIVNDRSAQFGGVIDSWSLEFCSSIALNPPSLVRNNGLNISADYEKVIDNNLLRVEDANNVDWELLYTVVKSPADGQLLLNGNPLAVGDKFSQFDLNNLNISYKSNSTVDESDNFYFTVVDGDGGWTGTHRFDINFVDQSVSTTDLNNVEIEVAPNPVNDYLQVKTNNQFDLSAKMEVFNLQGQLMIQQNISGSIRETINTAPLGNGIYFLKIQDDEKYSITKFVVER